MRILIAMMLFIGLSLGLTPKRLPNGMPRKFIPNISEPRKDLKLISPAQASLITKNWLNNIVLDIVNKKNKSDLNKGMEYDDLHIVTNINKLNMIIDDAQNKLVNEWTNMINNYNYSVLIFAYNPKGLQGINEVLFLVIAKLDRENKELKIKNIIQSPFWDEEQISSINLKNSLIDQNDYTNMTSISFDYLYDDNQRFKLAWNTWLMEIEDI